MTRFSINSFLRVVLSQAKQKTPLILPGFEAVDNPDDFSGTYTVCIGYLLCRCSAVCLTPLTQSSYDVLSE